MHPDRRGPDDRPCLFISTIGGRVGEALIDALAPDRHRLRIVGANSQAAASPNFLADAVHLVPPTNEGGAWTQAMRRILAEERPDLVVATRDGDLGPLARLKADPGLAGMRIWSPGPVSTAIVIDKAATAEFARARDLPFVATATDRAALAPLVAAFGFPLLAKPRRGTGSKGIYIVSTAGEAEACLDAGGYVIQPFLEAPDGLPQRLPDRRMGMPLIFALPHRTHITATAAVFGSQDVACLGAVRLDHHGIEEEFVLRVDDTDIGDLTLAYARALAALDFEGLLNIQCMRDRAGRLRTFEINGRLGGGVANRAMLGLGERWAILDALFGTRTTVWPPASPMPDRLERTRQFRAIPAGDAAELARTGVWRRRMAADEAAVQAAEVTPRS